MAEGICGSEGAEYALPVIGGGNGSDRDLPSSAAAISPASARYGFTSPPGTRHSTRSEGPCPTSRSAHVRLSGPHATAVGAKLPGRVALVGVDRRREQQRQLA